MATKKQETFSIKNFTGDVADLSRDIWLAGLGAVATVEEESTKFYETLVDTSSQRIQMLQDEATKIFDDLVDRGKKVEHEGRKQLTERYEAVKKEVASVRLDFGERQKELTEKIEETVTGSVEKTLEHLDVPTRTEVRTLTRKVEGLTKQVKALAASLEK